MQNLVAKSQQSGNKLFAVVRARGPAWDDSRRLEDQANWQAHAEFMDGLAAEGFVLLGGPLEGTREVLLIVRSRDEQEIRSRLAEDVWSRSDQLRIATVSPWNLRLGRLE